MSKKTLAIENRNTNVVVLIFTIIIPSDYPKDNNNSEDSSGNNNLLNLDNLLRNVEIPFTLNTDQGDQYKLKFKNFQRPETSSGTPISVIATVFQ